MAEDDKKAAESKPLETAPEHHGFSEHASSGDASSGDAVAETAYRSPSRGGAGKSSEWTASDDRGPLGRAEEGEEEAGVPHRHQDGADFPTGDVSPLGRTDEVFPPSSGAAGVVPPVDAASSPTEPIAAHEAATEGRDAPAPGREPATAHEPAEAPAQALASDRLEPAKRSLVPVAAALILGAVIGAGSAAFVYRGYADDSTPDPQVAKLGARVDALEKRPDPRGAISSLKSSVTALDSQVAALRKTGDAQAPAPKPAGEPAAAPDASARDVPAAAAPAAAQPTVDLAPLNQKVAALQAGLDALKRQGADTKTLQDKIAALESTLAGMKTATADTQAGVKSVEGQQKDIAGQQKLLAGKVMMPALAVVADSLVQQIDLGQPYRAQVDALAALGADPAKVAVLRENADKGVPSAKTLAAKFEPLTGAIVATAHKAPPNANLVDRLKSGMFSMVSVRRIDDTSGDDLPSRVARIKADLVHDDVAGALAAWSALPPDAQAKGQAWAALAKTSAEAMSAARALQHDAIVALGSKKS